MKQIEKSSTDTFIAMSKNLYIFGLNTFDQQEYKVLMDVILDQYKAEKYILHVKDFLSSKFDAQMKALGRDDRLAYVDMNKVLYAMRGLHIKALINSIK